MAVPTTQARREIATPRRFGLPANLQNDGRHTTNLCPRALRLELDSVPRPREVLPEFVKRHLVDCRATTTEIEAVRRSRLPHEVVLPKLALLATTFRRGFNSPLDLVSGSSHDSEHTIRATKTEPQQLATVSGAQQRTNPRRLHRQMIQRRPKYVSAPKDTEPMTRTAHKQ